MLMLSSAFVMLYIYLKEIDAASETSVSDIGDDGDDGDAGETGVTGEAGEEGIGGEGEFGCEETALSSSKVGRSHCDFLSA